MPQAMKKASATPEPEFPAWKAFVVQLSRRSGGSSGVLSGRLEHLSSGRRARFESPEELLEGLRRILREIEA